LKLRVKNIIDKKKVQNWKNWHAQRFHIGTFLATPGEIAKLKKLKLSL
jgi:hypothetical protein